MIQRGFLNSISYAVPLIVIYNLLDNYQKIRNELKSYDLSLYKKKEIIIFNKSDLIKKDDLEKKISRFKQKIKRKYEIISLFKKDDIQIVKKTLVNNVNK